MRSLLVRAALGVALVAILEALVVVALGWRPPPWTMIALPCVAGCATFLIAGRLRALRRQRTRRRTMSLRSQRPRVAHADGIRRAPAGAHDLDLVAISADDGRHLQ